MKSKHIKFLSAVLIGSSFLMGCGNGNPKDVNKSPGVTENSPDAVSSASKVSDVAALEKALSPEGNWIILLQNDITSDKDLRVEGELYKPERDNEGNLVLAGRNITLYNKDADGKITATYTLKAPKLIVKSKETIIKDGTFVGDIYVEAPNFTLYKTKVEGNVYFSNDEAKDTFKLEEGATVTGKVERK